MNEIDCIFVSNEYGVITGISYQDCKNALLVSFPHTVIEVDKCCETSKIIYTTKDDSITDVLSLCPGMLLTLCRCDQYQIVAINRCGKQTTCYNIDHSLLPKNLIFNPCTCKTFPIEVFFLKKNCYPYLGKWEIPLNCFGFILCCCNFKICDVCCPVCENPNKMVCQDILESIALVETALSHILNAEGEKLQKALCITNDIDKILRVNREVNQTLINAAHLEQMLYEKMTAILNSGLCDFSCSG